MGKKDGKIPRHTENSMIIFDLDGTLANCEHRKHFINAEKAVEKGLVEFCYAPDPDPHYWAWKGTTKKWTPDWDAFYEACDKDTPIEPVVKMWSSFEVTLSCWPEEIEIWSGRSESVRVKTSRWLKDNLFSIGECFWDSNLRMRPLGDFCPDEVLKERWLDEVLAQGNEIDYVFDDRPKAIRMWKRRGIFVFNCNQKDEEF